MCSPPLKGRGQGGECNFFSTADIFREILITDPTPRPSPTMGGEFVSLPSGRLVGVSCISSIAQKLSFRWMEARDLSDGRGRRRG